MDADYRLHVPASFDDSEDEDGQVHPVARRLFCAPTAAEVFEKARRWVGEHAVFVIDVSWNWAHDEPEPFMLSVYFRFDDDDEDEDEDEDEEDPPAAGG